LTSMVNASLREGRLPQSQKHAVVTPLHKKAGLNADELKNYRPVSNLTFTLKLVERAVLARVVGRLEVHGLMPRLQSAYRRFHSTETAVLKVLSDIFAAADCQQLTLGLLDLSAAFDCVDHDILLRRLKDKYGVSGTALDWIASYLSDRTQQVYYRGRLSVGVPHGSVLGPLLFLLYVAGVFDVIEESGCRAHSYADDSQVQLSAPAVRQTAAMDQLAECIIHIRDWMASHRLKLNEEKTGWGLASSWLKSLPPH